MTARNTLVLGFLFATSIPGLAQDPQALFRVGDSAPAAVKVHDAIYQAAGFGHTYMVVTDEGNVLIDTSLPRNAARHRELLRGVNDGPIRYVILTHGHLDHRGGVHVWKEEGTEVIAHDNYVEFLHYQARLAPFFARRNAAQFHLLGYPARPAGNYGAVVDATILVEKSTSSSSGD